MNVSCNELLVCVEITLETMNGCQPSLTYLSEAVEFKIRDPENTNNVPLDSYFWNRDLYSG